MRKRIVTSVAIIVVLLGLTGCSEKIVKPDTPQNTTYLLKSAIDNDSYNQFNQLFSEGRRNSISEEQFKSLEKLVTAGAGYTNYQLVEFENGEMILVRLTPDKDNWGNYYIEDVKMVPKDLKEIFEP